MPIPHSIEAFEALKQIPGLLDKPFVLVDVGCSEGIDSKWEMLGEALTVFGFDPLIAEVQRLNREALDNHFFEAAFVVGPDGLRRSADAVKSFPLSSAAQVQEDMAARGASYRQEKFNSGQQIRLAKRSVTLDDYFAAKSGVHPNFVKVDTDGFDFGVLRGASRILSEPGCVGVQVECQFHGDPFDNHSNTFSNIDPFLRQHGFSLYRLEPWFYSRRFLPAPFVYDIPAQTVSGPVEWAEALYFKDAALRHPASLDVTQSDRLPSHLLAALAIYGFSDVIAQIVSGETPGIEPFQAKAVLDRLISGNHVGARTHREFLDIFSEKPELWYPSAVRLQRDKVGGRKSWPRVFWKALFFRINRLMKGR